MHDVLPSLKSLCHPQIAVKLRRNLLRWMARQLPPVITAARAIIPNNSSSNAQTRKSINKPGFAGIILTGSVCPKPGSLNKNWTKRRCFATMSIVQPIFQTTAKPQEYLMTMWLQNSITNRLPRIRPNRSWSRLQKINAYESLRFIKRVNQKVKLEMQDRASRSQETM